MRSRNPPAATNRRVGFGIMLHPFNMGMLFVVLCAFDYLFIYLGHVCEAL